MALVATIQALVTSEALVTSGALLTPEALLTAEWTAGRAQSAMARHESVSE